MATESLRQALRRTVASRVLQPAPDEYLRWASLKSSIVAVEGTIAAGKSDMSRSLEKELSRVGIRSYVGEEQIPDRLMKLFYADLDRQQEALQEGRDDPGKPHAFPFQIAMLKQCQASYQKALSTTGRDGGLGSSVAFLDRSLVGNTVFAAMHAAGKSISQEDYEAYLDLLEHDANAPYVYDRILYVYTAPEVALTREKRRAREGESCIPLSYMQELDSAYYCQLYYQVTEGDAKAVVIDNSEDSIEREGRPVQARNVLDLLVDDALPRLTKDFFLTRMPSPEAEPSSDTIRRAMLSLWTEVTRPRLDRASRHL